MILDQNGKPIDMAALREPQTAAVAHLRRTFEDHPSRGLTPQRLHQILQEAEQGNIIPQLDLADDMEERDGHLFAELDKRTGAVALLEHSIAEPERATPAEKKITEQVREWMEGYDLDMLIRSMMSAALRSFSCNEMVWGVQQRVLLPTLTERPHRWFQVDRETRNQLRLRTLDVDAKGEQGQPLAPYAWIEHRHKTRNGYLARGGLVRVLALPYLYCHYATRDFAEFLELFGIPPRIGMYPSGAGDDEKRALLRAVTQLGHNAAGIIPSGMVIDFKEAAKGNEAPFQAMTSRMEAIESKVILGQTLSASQGTTGSHALGKVHNEVRHDIRDSDARQIERTITRQLIAPMVLLNIPGADPARLPRFQLQTTEAEDMQVFADTLPKLTGIGMQIPSKWAHDKLRIPEPADGEAVLAAPPPPPPPVPGAGPGEPKPDPKAPPPKPGSKAALKAQFGEQQLDALDVLVAEAAGDWQVQLQPLVNPLLAELDRAVAAGETIEAFRARLPQLVTLLDYTPMGERVARTAFSASLAGAADLELGGDATV